VPGSKLCSRTIAKWRSALSLTNWCVAAELLPSQVKKGFLSQFGLHLSIGLFRDSFVDLRAFLVAVQNISGSVPTFGRPRYAGGKREKKERKTAEKKKKKTTLAQIEFAGRVWVG